MILDVFKENISALFFLFFKYIEVFLNGLLMLLIAELIGPDEMGKSISSLLYITYSTYLSLGLNTVIVKNFKKVKKEERIDFLRINFQLLIVLSSLNFIITYFVFSKDIFLFVSIISIGNLFRSFFSAYFRVIDKIYVLNINNILLSVFLIFFTFIYVNNWSDYLRVWCVITCITVFAYPVFELNFFLRIFKSLSKYPLNSILKESISEGLKLSAIAGLSTIYLSVDRLIINNMYLSNSLKGTYQFADNFSTAVFIGASALIFFYTPEWIDKVRNDNSFANKLFRVVNLSLIAIPFISLLVFFIAFIVENYWFTDYVSLSKFVFFTTFLKLLILVSGIQSLIFISLNMEIRYLKLNFITLSLLAVTLIYFVFYDFNNKEISIIPIIVSLDILVLLFIQRVYLRKNIES